MSKQEKVRKLKNDNYELKISYVGYQDQFITLKQLNKDSIISLQLFPKTNTLNDVKINSKIAKLKKRVFEFGYFNQKSLCTKAMRTSLKLGAWIKNPDSSKMHLLEGIKFRLNNNINIPDASESLEIKLYGIK